MMRRPPASALISFPNSPRFSPPIRPLSLMTTSPSATLVIFSIHPLLRILIAVTSFTHACNGNHSAKRKLLKLRRLTKFANWRKLYKDIVVKLSKVAHERGLAVLRGIHSFEVTLANLQRPDFRLQCGSRDTKLGSRTGRSVHASSAFAQGSLNDLSLFGSRLSS